jgi:flagellar protein FlbD
VIRLTRLNGEAFVLNSELIRTLESRPDTTITLLTGDVIVVREGVREVVGRVIEYGRLLRRPLDAPIGSTTTDSPPIWGGAGAEGFDHRPGVGGVDARPGSVPVRATGL